MINMVYLRSQLPNCRDKKLKGEINLKLASRTKLIQGSVLAIFTISMTGFFLKRGVATQVALAPLQVLTFYAMTRQIAANERQLVKTLELNSDKFKLDFCQLLDTLYLN